MKRLRRAGSYALLLYLCLLSISPAVAQEVELSVDASKAGAKIDLNIFARHADRVRMANIAQMVNVLQAMILTDEGKMVLTPTYHVFRMYVPFQGAASVPVAFEAGTYAHGDVTLPRVDAVAAKAQGGKLSLRLEPKSVTVVSVGQ